MLIRKVKIDGKDVFWLQCPQCKIWQILDDDQYYGRVSVECSIRGCDFHETHDLSKVGVVETN